jgi:hypothetical protein
MCGYLQSFNSYAGAQRSAIAVLMALCAAFAVGGHLERRGSSLVATGSGFRRKVRGL